MRCVARASMTTASGHAIEEDGGKPAPARISDSENDRASDSIKAGSTRLRTIMTLTGLYKNVAKENHSANVRDVVSPKVESLTKKIYEDDDHSCKNLNQSTSCCTDLQTGENYSIA